MKLTRYQIVCLYGLTMRCGAGATYDLSLLEGDILRVEVAGDYGEGTYEVPPDSGSDYVGANRLVV